jgi:hypothetical protein
LAVIEPMLVCGLKIVYRVLREEWRAGIMILQLAVLCSRELE